MNPDRLFELVQLKELLDKYGDELHFLQCVEGWGLPQFSAQDAANLLLLSYPDRPVFEGQREV